MKIVGVTLVRNEQDVLLSTLRHVLSAGVQEVLVIDNGSTDATPALLRRAQEQMPVRFRVEQGPFEQVARMTGLAEEARALGADWVLPFDADEFVIARSALTTVLRSARAPALHLPVRNLVQVANQLRPSERPLGTMRYVARGWARRPAVLDGRASFVELRYPPKVCFRAAPDVVVRRGNHDVDHPDGPAAPCTELRVLHAPLRSRAHLELKAISARRHIDDAGGTANASWQYRRWAELQGQGCLGAEWRANSCSAGVLHRHDGSSERLSKLPPGVHRALRRLERGRV